MADEETTPETAEVPEASASAFFPAAEAVEAATGEVAPAPAEPAPAADPAAPATPPEPETPEGRDYADLAKRDRDLRDRQEQLRAQESDLRTYQSLKQQAAEDPGAALRALGIDPFTLSDKLLGIEPETAEAAPQAAPGLSREEAQQMFGEQLSHQKRVWDEEQQISTMIRDSGHDLVKDRAARDPRLVKDLHAEAVKRFQESGTLPDINGLLKEREDAEQANLFASLDRVMQLDIVKERYKLSGGTQPATATTKAPPPVAPSPTLSQALVEEPNTDERPRTEEEKWAVFNDAMKNGPPKQ